MKKIALLVLFAIVSSCAISSPPAGFGVLYTQASEVVYYDPYIIPRQKVSLCSKNYFGLISKGDNGFDALKLNSQIRKIATIERVYSGRFLIFAKSCLIVKGE